MIIQPTVSVQVVAARARSFHNAPSLIASMTTRAREQVIEKAARDGHSISRPTVHVTTVEDAETQDLRIVAVIAGANGMDGQLFGGECDGLRVALDMPNGWEPQELISQDRPGGRRVEYRRAGIESTTGQWIYTLHAEHQPPAAPAQQQHTREKD